MEGFSEWFRRRKLLIGFLIVLSLCVPLTVVHFLFKLTSPNAWFTAEWSAGDLIQFIAGYMAFAGTVLLGALALWQNQQIQRQHIETLAPSLSMNLTSISGWLFLTVSNSGQSDARDINLSVESIMRNGENTELMLDDLFSDTFDLFPSETIQGCVALSGANISTSVFPQIIVTISYLWPQLNKRVQYTRRVTYDNDYTNKVSAEVTIDNRNLEKSASVMATATVRMANYLDGCQLLAIDELNVLPGKSLRNDLAETFNTRESVPELFRQECIQQGRGDS